MKSRKTKKIVVFVCTGNTCRSPMAEYLFRQKTESLGLKKLQIVSAGTKANLGDKMNEKSAQILLEKGMDVSLFSSKPIDEKMLKDSLAIVCMTDHQRDMLMEMRWKVLRAAGEEEIENNVYSFSEITGYEVLDPYGRDMDCYRYVYELLAGGMSALTDKILPETIRAKYIPKPRKPRETTAKKKTAEKSEKKTAQTKKKKSSNA